MARKPPPEWDLKKIEKYAENGLTIEEIARCLGYAPSTFYRYKSQLRDIEEAVQKGRAKSIKEVANVLREKAIEGDVVAAKYWLNNVGRSTWNDRREVEHKVDTAVNIVVGSGIDREET